MYILNIASAIRKMSVNELRDLKKEVKGRSYSSMKCLKKGLLLENKSIEKIPDPRNPKEQYYRKEKNKISKTTRNNYLSTKHFSKPKHC